MAPDCYITLARAVMLARELRYALDRRDVVDLVVAHRARTCREYRRDSRPQPRD